MGKNKPLVSIMTITRNRANLIDDAINSVLNQSYNNIEYIIVNGASNDNTIDVVNNFKDKRIILINLDENYSLFKTMQLGFGKSQGDYITFLDDDDEYLPTKIEKQLNLIESLPKDYGFVYCWMDYFDKTTKKLLREHHTKLRGDVAELVVEQPIVSGTPTFFFRRSVFEELGGWKDNIGINSDWEFAARACQHYKVDYVPEVLVRAYENHGSLRMSEKEYYKDIYNRNILFHTYFLKEFSSVFNKYPSKKRNHLYTIAYSQFLQGNIINGFKVYFQLIRVNFSFKTFVLPLNCLLKFFIGKN